jgi:hypothetical protein
MNSHLTHNRDLEPGYKLSSPLKVVLRARAWDLSRNKKPGKSFKGKSELCREGSHCSSNSLINTYRWLITQALSSFINTKIVMGTHVANRKPRQTILTIGATWA